MKVAIIGLGNQNLNDHIPSLLTKTGVEISAVCDPDKSKHDIFKQKFPEFNETSKFLEDPTNLDPSSFDFAVVSVPHDQYLPIIRFLSKIKKPFLKEKPFARNYAEALEIMQISDIENLCFVCTKRRFDPLYNFVKSNIEKIGNPYLFNAAYKLNISDPQAGWRGDKNIAGGGCVVDMGYHLVDQLLWWFGLPDKTFASVSSLAVEGTSNYAEDSATISFKYSSGLHGSLLLSRTAGQKTEIFDLNGSRGYISGDKHHVSIKNKSGDVIDQFDEDPNNNSTKNQLDFFLNRLETKSGFRDVLERNLSDMLFIQKCYDSAYEKI